MGNGWCRGCVAFKDSGLIPDGQFRVRQAPKKMEGDQNIAVQQKKVSPNVPKEATRVHSQAIKRQLTVSTASVPKPKKTKSSTTVSVPSPVRSPAKVSGPAPRIQPSTSPDSNAVGAEFDVEAEGATAQPFYPSVGGSPSKLPSYAASGSEFDLDSCADVSKSKLPQSKKAKNPKQAVASGDSARPAGPVPRALSKTLDANGQPLSHIDLKKLVTDLNLKLPKCERSMNVAHLNISQLDDWVVKYYEGKKQTAAMLRVTATVKVEVCMRMLALLADMSELLALFKDKCGGSSQHQIDAGGKPLKNTGLGMNLNHAYWPAMVQAFNDSSKIPDFPFEYVVNEDVLTFHSNGVDHVSTPAKMKDGFFAGLGIKQPRIPEGFYDGFFDIQRLDAIFVNGMAEYHNAETNFHQSGQHGKPLWFFVQPCRTQLAEEQALYLEDKMKRWDSLAFDCFKNEVQQVKMQFTKTVPNGVGGAPTAAQLVSALPPGTSTRVTAATRQQLLDSQSTQLHDMQMQNLQAKATARTKCDVDVVIGMLDKIRKLQVLADDFKKIGSTDMEEHCIKQVDALKADLLARDLQQHSPVTFGAGQGGNTPRTPFTQGGNTPRTPLTPHTLTLSAPGTPAS
jgi:hypothetical protein